MGKTPEPGGRTDPGTAQVVAAPPRAPRAEATAASPAQLLHLAALASPDGRQEAARSLARSVQAEELIVFSADPELQILLPAPGFPQTLPHGRAWRAFLADCTAAGHASALLPFGDGPPRNVLGVAGSDGTVLAMVGGTPELSEVRPLAVLTPLLGAAFRGESIAATAAGQAHIALAGAQRAAALAAALDRVRRELRDADRRKDEFLAMLAHELRNPLAPIRSALELLRQDGSSRPDTGAAREVIARQLKQMVHLIDDLLDVSRVSRGTLVLRKERVELRSVVQAAVESTRPLIEQRGHTLTVHLPEHAVDLDGDATRLTQVFLNLLNNAAKYSGRGGRIALSATVDARDVVVAVVDDGIGIAPEMIDQVFNMFIQVDRTLERSEGGLGIGLTLVRHLVSLHGGTLEARSEGLGKGSEFRVRLPLAAPRVERPAATPQVAVKHPPSTRRILVVDDNLDGARSLAMLLEAMGHQVQSAHDGLAAVATAAAFQPDLILLDIGMPHLNGYDAARRIRQLPGGEDVMLIALTGWGQEEDRRRSREAGFDAHLVKPFEIQALQALLETEVRED